MNARASNAEQGIAWACVLIALGGLALGCQVDRNGSVSGTGLAPFAIGAFIAVAAAFARARAGEILPRDVHAAFASVFGLAGLAFLASGVLAPGGPWMFVEVVVILVAAWRSNGERVLGRGTLFVLASFFLFRAWVSYQGSRWHWQVLQIDVPVLSWLPFEALEPVKRLSLGSFTPHEMGWPPAGLEFATTMSLWALGFALVAGGMTWLQTAAREHENDRIQALIATLPNPLAALVEKLLPEDDWRALGLHGLSERRLAKRIETLVAERARAQRDLGRALSTLAHDAQRGEAGFSGEIARALGTGETTRP